MQMDIQEMGWGDMNWINLGEDRDHWQAVVNVVMNLGFCKAQGIS